jgi:hypothetical protein
MMALGSFLETGSDRIDMNEPPKPADETEGSK